MGENRNTEGGQGENRVFVYPNDIRGRGYILQYVPGIIGIEPDPMRPDKLQVVHTVNGDRKIGTGYVRVASYA